ncbi:hypothetical protein FXE51_15920 [Vibrio mimicus]|nr:hypothetical protein FXE51_15920 [Vibrio mimicus]
MQHKPSSRRPLSPQNSLQTQNATRHESLFNVLLCLIFNSLYIIRTKINSALIRKQKPKQKKQKRLIIFENQTLNFAAKTKNLRSNF